MLNKAEQWANHDLDSGYQAKVRLWIDENNTGELNSAFNGPLTFGTAGLRGEVGPGESRMNLSTVAQATYGVAQWLNEKMSNPKVVVGCDARHGSSEFYDITCQVLSAAGCTVVALPKKLPTPVTAFAVRFFKADAAVMITASHNPAKDNGYKLYLGGRSVNSEFEDGVQLVSPADKEIAELISQAVFADQIPLDTNNIHYSGDEIIDEYVKAAYSLSEKTARKPRIVITGLHGVGATLLKKVLTTAGFTNVIDVPQQNTPDPEFPTVSFPNPEEQGALNLAIETAKENQADLIIAVDPDADRCSVAIPNDENEWVQLSGDTMGSLLGEYLARKHPGVGTFANSIVSSSLLQKIAEKHSIKFENTLTGFKWIGRVPHLAYGYEEAIGFCVNPQKVRDKDGITAGLVFAVIASEYDIWELLCELDATYGAYVTKPLTIRLDSSQQVHELSQKMNKQLPVEIAGSRVEETFNLSDGWKGLAPTTGFMFITEYGDKIVVRPSGTEPKLKCYMETIHPTRSEAEKRMNKINESMNNYFDSLIS